MVMKLQWRAAMLLVCMTLAVLWSNARADEVPLITGEHWIQSTEQLKKVFLVGIANVIQVEMAYHGGNPPTDAQSFVPRFAKGLKGHSLDSVREGLNSWYGAHPEQLKRPVIETIWFEMVLPGLKTK